MVATAAILKFLVMYNQYLWPLIVVQQESVRPVMVGLGYFFQLNTAWGEVMAYLTVDHPAGAGLLPGASTRPPLHRFHRIDRSKRLMSLLSRRPLDLGQLVCP